MKFFSKMVSKLSTSIQNNPKAWTRFGIFVVAVLLAREYPMTASVIGALAFVVLLNHYKNIDLKKDLDFFQAPAESAKELGKDIKSAIDERSAKKAAAKETANKETVKTAQSEVPKE